MRLWVGPAGVVVEAQVGDHLIDLADEQPDLGVPFSCRSASCGTCRVLVLRGAEAFAPAGEDERDTLAAFDADAQTRLCCQLHVVRDVAEVRLHAADE